MKIVWFLKWYTLKNSYLLFRKEKPWEYGVPIEKFSKLVLNNMYIYLQKFN